MPDLKKDNLIENGGIQKMSKTEIILNYLREGNYISDSKAVELCNSYRLSAIIHELRKRHNYNIQDRWIEQENGYKFKEYYLQDN